MNWCMLTRALAVATGLVAVYFPVAGQQANQPEPTKDRAAAFEQSYAAGALDRAFALSLYQSKILSAKNSFLLFNKGRVLAWSDGGRLASENALASVGMASLNLFSDAYFVPDTFESAATCWRLIFRAPWAMSISRSQLAPRMSRRVEVP